MGAVSYCPWCKIEVTDPARVFCEVDGARLRPISERGGAWTGRVLQGKYKLLFWLGAGGMAEVFEAEELATGRHVAVKILLPHLAAHPNGIERFRREAEMISRIAHPNVVAIRDFGPHEYDGYYMVMELLDGRPLSRVMADGGISPRRAFRIAMQICEGMAAAHERNVIHRDLKPDNIFVKFPGPGADPEVKILDFGIGKLLTDDASSSLTIAGTVFGTPEYMSPEQCTGQTLGPASDVYAVGAIMYEMLLGTPPFTGPSFMAILARQATEQPLWKPELAEERGIPAEAAAIVLRALSKIPMDRHESMLELQGEIAPLLGRMEAYERESSASTVPRRSSTGRRSISVVPLSGSTGADHEVVEIASGVYWVGRRHGRLLECNSYLRVFKGNDTEITLLIDPGPPRDFDLVGAKVAAVIGSVSRLDHLFLNHQDPDVCASAASFQRLNPRLHVFCSEDTWRLVQFYGLDPKRHSAVDSFTGGRHRLPTGHRIRYVPTPFCHYRGAVALYDPESRVLFSGDLFGGVAPPGGSLVSSPRDIEGVDMFHQIFMPATRALSRAVDAVRRLVPAPCFIAPQHGAVVGEADIPFLLEHVASLRVGLDLLDAGAQDARALTVANGIVHELAAIVGDDEAAKIVDGRANDGSFTDLFVARGRDVVEFRVEPDRALDALTRAALLAVPPARQQELRLQIAALRAVRKPDVRGRA